MARIDTGVAGGTSSVLPFTGTAEVLVNHGLGHRPIVEVLIKQPGGMYGVSGFGNGGYGSEEVYVPLDRVNYSLVHEDDSTFRVLMNNYYDGELVYI